MAREPDNDSDAKKEVPASLVRLANRVLWVFAALFLLNAFFAFHLHRKTPLQVAAVVGLVAMLAARLYAKPARRVPIALMLVPAALLVSAYEGFQSWRRPRDGSAAHRRGEPFDSRGLFEVVHDLQKEDPTVQSFVIPRALLTHNLDAPRWADEMLARTVRPDWGLVVDGQQTLPFGGVSSKRTVFCNENGYWAEYVADEHGFNNPKGIWGQAPLDAVVIGDSYSQGACVPPDKITAAYVRQKLPKTLTLGMCANGPLMEYANLKEFVVDLKPRIVLWVYYNNDLSDMDVEAQSTLLLRYVDDDSFRQNLAARQPQIDEALDDYLDAFGARSPAWPSSLAAVGLTRQSTPLGLQDLVMREQHSNFSAFLRLDWFTNTISTRFLDTAYFDSPPKWDLFKKVLGKAKTTVDSWGGKMYFVYLPDVHYLASRGKKEQPNRNGVLAAAKEAGLPVIDVHEVFLQQPNPDGFRPHYDAHFTEEGFALVGKVINDALTKDGF